MAGTFEKAGGVTVNSLGRWDGATWHDIGGGFTIFGAPATLSSIARYGLFATGAFFPLDGEGLNHLAWWDGTSWRTVGEGLNDLGESLLVTGETLWIGGSFQAADQTPSFGIARWSW